MTTSHRLDKFTLRDKFGWNRQQLLEEAVRLAKQHADLMGWEMLEVKDITPLKPTKDGEHLCYSFEIWGIGTPSLGGAEDEQISESIEKKTSLAAKQPEL